MQTETHEIADNVFRFSTFVPEVSPHGFTVMNPGAPASTEIMRSTVGRSMAASASINSERYC